MSRARNRESSGRQVERNLRRGVQRDRQPDVAGLLLGAAVVPKERVRHLRTVELEPAVLRAVVVRQAEIVEEPADVGELGIHLKPPGRRS